MRQSQRKFNYIKGQQFNALTFLEFAPRGANGISRANCQCVCGKFVTVRTRMLGEIKSCGCKNPRAGSTHKMSGTPEYQAYQAAKNRCTNSKDERYADYGGRGIEFRFKSFEQFYAELGSRPQDMSLDRIRVNGHYEPGNVRWATASEQRMNQRLQARIAELEKQLADCRSQHAK